MNPCLDALSSLLCCCLNMSLSCPPHSSCSSPLSFLTTKPWFDMQVLAPSLSLTHTNYFGLRQGISVVVSLLQFPRHLHYSCVCVCVREREREREREERVKRLCLLMMRITEPTAITTTILSQISLGTSFDLSFTAKTHLSSGGTCFHRAGKRN